MTASEDGSATMVRSGSWTVEKKWERAHKGSPVNHLTIHSSGKLALSLGKDLSLRTWNLVKGRQVYATNLNSKPSLGKVCECVESSPDGKYFCLTGAKVCEIWIIETAACVKTISCESKPNCIAWIDDSTVVVGMEDGNLMIAGINRDEDVVIRAYEKRVKAVKFLNGKLVTVCSTGEVTMWSVTAEHELEKMCSIQIGCRPICIALIETSDAGEVVKEEVKVEEKIGEKKGSNFGRSVEIEVEEEEIGFKTPKNKKNKRKNEEIGNLVESPNNKKKKKDEEQVVEEVKKSSKKGKKVVEEVSSLVEETPTKKNKKKAVIKEPVVETKKPEEIKVEEENLVEETPSKKNKKKETNKTPKKPEGAKMVEQEETATIKKKKPDNKNSPKNVDDKQPQTILRSGKKKIEKRDLNVVSSPKANKDLFSAKKNKKPIEKNPEEEKLSPKKSPKKPVDVELVLKSSENVSKADKKNGKNKKKATDIGNVSLQEESKNSKKFKNNNKRKSMF